MSTAIQPSIPNVTVSAEITKDDLIAIRVNDYEERVLEIDRDCDKRLAELAKQVKEAEGRVERALQALADQHYHKAATPLLKQLRTFSEFRTAAARTSAELLEKKQQARVELRLYKDQKAAAEASSYGFTLVDQARIRLPKTVQSVIQAQVQVQEEVRQVQRRKAEARQSLAQIGRLERKARANMARAILSQTEMGRALLGETMATKALPGMVDPTA